MPALPALSTHRKTSHRNLCEQVRELAACLNATNYRFIKLLGEMDQTDAWRDGGFSGMVNWLDHQCGMAPCAARERLRIARCLRELTRIDDAFKQGIISYSKVRAITRVAGPETEVCLLKMAATSSAAQLERLVRTYERTPAARQPSHHTQRSVEWYIDEDGMWVLNARLPADMGALLVKALEKARDNRFAECEAYLQARCEADLSRYQPVTVEAAEDPLPDEDAILDAWLDSSTGPDQETLMTGAVADTLLTPTNHDSPVTASEDVTTDAEPISNPDTSADVSEEAERAFGFHLRATSQRNADALVDIAEHWLATPFDGTRVLVNHQIYQVMLHVDRHDLDAGSLRYYLGDKQHRLAGTGVSAETGRRMACDATLTSLTQDQNGRILNFGRRERVVPKGLLTALKQRDQSCRFPGCDHSRYLQAHHVVHWLDGGETSADNLIMISSRHHAYLHEKHFSIREDHKGEVSFYDNRGGLIPRALNPQFPEPLPSSTASGKSILTQPAYSPRRVKSPFDKRSDRELATLLHHRERWGKQKRARRLKQFLSAHAD